MDLLWAINLPFELNIVLTRYNIAELPRMLAFCQSHKLSAKFFEHVSLRYEYNSQNLTFVPVPHLGLSQFLEVASEVFGADCFVKCPEYGEANYVYSTGAYTLRYCRYLCPFGLCYKTGTRVDARGFVYACMGAYGTWRIDGDTSDFDTISLLREVAANRCAKLVQVGKGVLRR